VNQNKAKVEMHPLVKLLVDILMFVRPIWVAPIVLPLSWIARWIEILQGGTFMISLKDHRARVEKLAADVRTAKANGTPQPQRTKEASFLTPKGADAYAYAYACTYRRDASLLGPQSGRSGEAQQRGVARPG
jgi:hypothetical protein